MFDSRWHEQQQYMEKLNLSKVQRCMRRFVSLSPIFSPTLLRLPYAQIDYNC